MIQVRCLQSNVSSTVFASNSDVFIGKLSDAYFINRNQSYEYQNRHAIDGSVDELRIYNRGLSDAEIQELYQMTTQVVIDIKPGSDPNSINLKSKGVIPVAILTTEDFDATTVDPLSVEFGPNGATEAHGKGHIEDVDEDGDLDLILHFYTQGTGIACKDIEAGLSGETFDGQMIEGFDSVHIVKCN